MTTPPDAAQLGREERRAATRERILETAMRLLVEQGWEGLTIAKLARELDYAVGALYRYFPGKSAILTSLERRVVERLGQDLERAAEAARGARPEGSPEAALLELRVAVGVYETLPLRRPTDFKLLMLSLGEPRELVASEEMDPSLLPGFRALIGGFAARLIAATAAGALTEGNALRRTLRLWGALHGVLQLRKQGRFEPTLADAELAEELVEDLLAGFGADRAALDGIRDDARRLAHALP